MEFKEVNSSRSLGYQGKGNIRLRPSPTHTYIKRLRHVISQMKLETGRAGADLSDSTINPTRAKKNTHTCQQKCFELMDTKDHGSVTHTHTHANKNALN
jgi:hypothetical protein